MTHPAAGPVPPFITRPGTTYQHTKLIKADEIDFGTLKGWLTTCESEHGEICNKHTVKEVLTNSKSVPGGGHGYTSETVLRLPKRLVDVRRSCIIQTGGVPGDEFMTGYLALSYVWADGGDSQFKLTRRDASSCSIEGYIRSLGDKVPQNIRDGLYVCDKIGVPYLWVDALCIAQDDEAEKADEIARMDEIYSHARAVLAIAVGPERIPGIHGRRRDLAIYQEKFADEVFMTSRASTTWTARISKWNTRAWTFQECMLAKRIIFLTDTYAFFRCSSAFYREDDAPEPISSHKTSELMDDDDTWVISGLHDIPPETSARVVYDRHYKPKLGAYLRRSMTYDSDSVLAFSGILKVLSRYLGEFHFGLPKRYFGVSLLWDDPNRGIFRRRPDFPSWSWAGWEWDFRFSSSDKNKEGPYGSQQDEAIVPLTIFRFKQETGKLELLFDDDATAATFTGDEAEAREKKMEAGRAHIDHLMAAMDLGYEEGLAQLHSDMEHNRIKVLDEERENAALHERERETLLLQLQPPTSHLDISYSGFFPHDKNPSHFIVFYTSVASLKLAKSATREFAPGSAHVYEVRGKGDERLFSCYLDPKYREGMKEEDFEFAVLGLRPGRRKVVLMLLEKGKGDTRGKGEVGVYYRLNWACNASQQLYVEDWLRQDPKQKLVILG